ncbi:hypothetical protein [Streptomyces fructofermentans]|uniref:Uncharacterized protein n=1 Tax=Streptomyces fructofermentans TaxID=152141 RepID=A0A918N994_9ACTN|nr:hypothetical protein [Streptomyces fructofermentans]GGX49886.1 hypothetical protein GCM10010515_16370 [Streptomyces fructofermentans]
MSLVVCSLKWDAAHSGTQKIRYDKDGYHLVRFPYTAGGESYDPWRMHDPSHGASTVSAFPDARSGLVWPSHDGWAVLSAMVFWTSDARAIEYRARFVRDPLGSSTGYDSTATADSAITRGGQYRTYLWQMFVTRGTPVGLKVSARGARDTRISTPLTLAEFKLAIHTDVKTP